MKVSKVPFGLGALLALSGSAHATVLNAGGEGLQVDVGTDLSVQVSRDEQPQLAGPGIVASVDGRLIGSGIAGASPWTPVWQSRVIGDGSVEQPYQVDTIVGVDGVEVLATVRYVTGAETVQIALHVTPANLAVVRLYHLIDNGPNDPGTTFWSDAAGQPMTLGFLTNTSQVEIIGVEGSEWSYYHAGEYGTAERAAADGLDLDNELDAAEGRRSLGIEWTNKPKLWPEQLEYQLRFKAVECAHCGDPTPPPADEGTPGFGGSGLDPNETGEEPDDGWGSDDVGPPPTGPHAVGADDEDPTISNDGDEDLYGAATDDAAGCSAGGHGAGGAVSLLLIGLAVGGLVRRRTGR